MLVLDNNTPALFSSHAIPTADTTKEIDEFGQMVMTRDSIAHSIKDSLFNMDKSDLKAVVTGDNTYIKDSLHQLTQITVSFIPKLIGAILVLWIGLKLAKLLKNIMTKALSRRGADSSLKSFLGSLVDVLLKAMVIIMAMDMIGIKATSFIALLGALGLAVGMALQGTLQNFAGGVIILLMKPFKVDDYIECGQYVGYIKEIRIFYTFMRTFSGRIIVIPNSELATKSITNHNKEPQIRLEVVASVAYGTDLKKAKDAIWEVIKAEPLVMWDYKQPEIIVTDLANSSVDLTVWIWTTADKYWDVWRHIREDIYIAFNNANIEIPFPQVTVHQGKEGEHFHMAQREDAKIPSDAKEEKLGTGK